MVTEDSYVCDICGSEYYFSNSYESFIHSLTGDTMYLIFGWYGEYDGYDMCNNCWDNY